jgi:hypothetical protein
MLDNKESKKEKRVLILFLHDSIGELYVALPILWFLKKDQDIKIYFVSNDPNILEKFQAGPAYIQAMQEVGSFYFGSSKSLLLLAKLLIKKNLIIQMSCFSGFRIIDKIYYSFLKQSTAVFFPHSLGANAVNDIKNAVIDRDLNLKLNSLFASRFGDKGDLLTNTINESNYLEQIGWSKSSQHSIGAQGYRKEWLKKLFSFHKLQKEGIDSKPFTIFVPLRGPHPYFLSKSNYEYLINSLAKIFKNHPTFHFLVKLHPRQKSGEIKTLFDKNSNVFFSGDSPFELASKSDLTIGFCTSALIDSVAAGTPAVEFHKHAVTHSQLVKKDGRLISIFEYLELCMGFNNANALENFLKELDITKLKLLQKRQYVNLVNFYQLNENNNNNLETIFNMLFKKASYAKKEQKNNKKHFRYEVLKRSMCKIFSSPRRALEFIMKLNR